MSSWVTNLIIVASSILALVFAAIYRAVVGNVAMDNNGRLLGVESHIAKRVHDISLSISDGAAAFLSAEFKIMGYFIVGFSVILAIALGFLVSASSAIFTVIAFILGSLTSMLSGYIGMRIAVYSNSRTAGKS